MIFAAFDRYSNFTIPTIETFIKILKLLEINAEKDEF
jgi:hypothetical protein